MDKDMHVERMFIATEYAKEQEYWINRLSGDWEKAVFPYDHSNVTGNKRTTGIYIFRLPMELFFKVTQAMNESDFRLHVILTVGLVQLINKYIGAEDIIIGTPIDRQEMDADFINTFLVLRNCITPVMTFKDLLIQVGQTISDACDNQNYPLETLPYELNRQVGENADFPLFDVALLLENVHEKRYIDYIKFNVLFSFLRTEEYIEGKVEYNTSLYEYESIERIAHLFIHLLQEGLNNPMIPIADLDALNESDKNHLVREMNKTEIEFPGPGLVHKLFEEQVDKTPLKIAVEEVDTGRSISYEELNRYADLLAILLIEKGLKKGMIEAVMGERTCDIITSILAILKIGGVFLPLDAQNPDERITFILKDSCAHILLSQKAIIEERRNAFRGILSGNIIAMDDRDIYSRKAEKICIEVSSAESAYIIYTSGTTGKPKGVIIEHKSLFNYVQFAKNNYVKKQALNFPLYTSISFDLTITSIFVPLVSGNTVVVYGGWNKGNLIERIVDDEKVGVIKLTPSHLSLIREKKIDNKTTSVKCLVVGGENLESQLAQAISDNFDGNIEIYNEYGPTEASVGCMLYRFDPKGDIKKRKSVSIGVPITNMQIYLLDKNLKPVPTGAAGEVHIFGVGVARGYLNRPELTSERFMSLALELSKINKSFWGSRDLFSKRSLAAGGKLYKTGDLACWLADGNIEFLGRVDQQVKIRGFRVELGEIEARLMLHESVKEAVVTIKGAGGDKHICAYIVMCKKLTNSELRDYLSRQLPDYMVPSYFVEMDAIPLTSNGKVDMKALYEPETKAEAVYVAPRNETEKKLVGIWGEILGIDIEIIGIDANFFELGGHSLSGTVLNAKIHKLFNVKLALVDLFRSPTVRELAQILEKSIKVEFIPIEPVEEKEYYFLSSAQERLFIIQQMELDSIGYNVPMVYEIEGKLNLEKFQSVFRQLIERHDVLRTSFILIDNKPVQRIHNHLEFELEYFDVTGVESTLKAAEIQHIINIFIRPFDFSRVPLLRAGLIQTDPDGEHFILMMDIHHIVTDGVSMDILIKEIGALYTGHRLSPLELHYKDFSEWQSSVKMKGEMVKQEAYWLKKFEGEIPVLELPIDFPRPPFQSFEGDRLNFSLENYEVIGLRELAAAQDVTLFMVILSTYNIFLSKLNGQSDLIIGTPIAGRRHTDLEYIVGIFINTLALRNYPDAEKSFPGFIQEIKINTLDAYDNQEYPFEDLVAKVSVKRDVGRNPLVDAVFALNNVDMHFLDIPSVEISELKILPYNRNYFASKVDILLNAYENSDEISFSLEYPLKLFKKETVKRFIQYFRQVITSVLANPNQKISEIEILSVEQKKKILYDFNETVSIYPKEKTIHELFEEQVKKAPDRIAVIGGSFVQYKYQYQITYRQLNQQSYHLADLLIQKGVLPDAIVGIMLGRSVEMIIGILGILKSGGAYLPIDSNYPRERIDYMLKDSGATLLAVANRLEGEKVRKWEGEKVFLESLIHPANYFSFHHSSFIIPHSNHLAYVIYTSGSTGKPKGVAVEHQGVVDYICWAAKTYIKEERCSLPFYTSISFDLTVTSVFTPLITGNSVVVYADDENSFLLDRIIDDNRVEVIKLTPSHLNLIKNKEIKIGTVIKRIIVGGEELETQLAEEIFRVFNGAVEIYNEYGPTETVVGSMIYKFVPRTDDRKNVLIGIPADNTCIYIMDKNRKVVPIGIPGEIYITGDGVARGYLNSPDLTLMYFVENPFKIGDRMYQTGDLGKRLPDGNIEFLGRVDRQVKIRGHRIESVEIEYCLKSHENVSDAVLVAKEDISGGKFLCAYIVEANRAGNPIPISELRKFLIKKLPDYMIPLYFVKLEKIPLNVNGKVDHSLLPDPLGINQGDEAAKIFPTNPIEKKLVEIWEKVLGRNNIGIHENFFMLGGDSIKSIQIISRMNTAGYKLEMRDLFQYPIISDLARRVKKLKRLPEQSVIKGTIPLTSIQRAFFNQFQNGSNHYNQAVMFHAKEGFDREAIKKVFSRIHEHHDALRMTYTFKRGADDSEIIQTCHGLEYPFSLEEYDLKNLGNNLDQFETKINEIQSGIDLEKGPLMKLGLFHLNDGDRLLAVVHHLVIDSVSWRVLLEDIDTLYGQYKRGEKLVLPPKTDSFKLWSERLAVYANSKSVLKEKPYWAGLESYAVTEIPKDFELEGNHVNDTRSVSFSLGEEETTLLLTRVNEAFKTEVNDILLTALGLGIQETFGQDRVLLALEGHGREDILEDMDVSRTVGWFTSVYPVLMDFSYRQDRGRQLKEIKEVLRKIPKKGVGYGILKFLTGDEHRKDIHFKLNPKISFNYLGQVDADVNRLSSFELAKESVGNTQSITRQREYELDISGVTTNNRLTMTIYYNGMHFKPEMMAKLAGNFESELKHIIEFCLAKENKELTPSDFVFKGLSIESVDKIMETYQDVENIYTLTPMQEGFLFHTLVDSSSYSYFEQISYRLQGELDIDIIEKSLNELLKRHEILRTVFVYKNIDRPVQVVLKNSVIDFYYEDIRKLEGKEKKESFIKEFKERDKDHSFDFSKGALMRVSILNIDELEYEFAWSFHHILMDGWCIGILNAEFFEIYSAYKENRPYRLPAINPYRTYIQWLDKQDKDVSAGYWENYLDSFEEQTGVPKTRILTKEANRYRNETFSVVLDSEMTAALNRLAAGNHVTLNIITQTMWGILLGKYNGKEDVVFGAVVSGRPFELEGVESMVGLFINTIPVRIRFEERMKLNMLCRKTQEEALASEPHHYSPLAEIQARSILKQNLIDHLFAFENYPISERLEGFGNGADKRNTLSFKLSGVDIFEQIHYDFNIVLAGTDRLRVTFRYNGNTYDSDFVEKIADRYCLLFDQVIGNGEIEIGDLIIVSELERKQLLCDFNDNEAKYPKDKTIHQLFEEQVERTPDRIAVFGQGRTRTKKEEKKRSIEKEKNEEEPFGRINAFGGVHLSYRDLNNQSNRLAGLLIEKGVLADSIVGIMMERSVEMIAGIMGILKSGGAYLPIDQEYPEERINYMLKDSGATILLTDYEKKKMTNCQLSIINYQLLMNPQAPFHHSSFIVHHSNQLSYIIYTSGTTGRPKGALIEHVNVVRLLFNDRSLFDFNENDTWTMFHSYCFDFSVWEVYGALLYGGKLNIIPKIVTQDPRAFLTLLKQNCVTILNQTPSAFYNLIIEEMKSPDQSLDLRYVIFGGEALSPAKLNEWQKKYPGTKLINMFGITETTVHVTYKEICVKEIEAGISCIGKPIPTLSTYIFDDGLKLVPIGTPGELCVGGHGVGRGYLNRPELSHEKFVLNPYKQHERLYKSGDLARLSIDGEMEYLGRIDQQVQIRGFRVEAGEIENRLLKHEDIKDVVVIAKKDRDNNIFLTAHIVSDNELAISQLRGFLSNELPEYMIPAYFVRVPQIPLTLNGKIDKSKLPEPDVISGEGYAPPANEIEEELAAAWKEVLGLEKIGVADNFFNIGGDSIKAIRLVNSINNRLQTNIKILNLFTNNTIRELALVVNSGIIAPRDKELEEIEKEVEELKTRIMKSGKMPEDVEDVFPMSDIEKGMIFHAYENPDEAIYHDQFVYHRKFPGFEPDIFRKALDLLTEKHSILRTSFNVDDFNEFIHFIHKSFPAAYNHFDISELENISQEKYILKYMEDDRKDRWDISSPPLWRMATFNRGNDNIYAVWTFHHAILDGWSNASIITELNNVYLALKVDKNYNPGRLKISYKDFVFREMIEKRKTENIDFWKNELEDYKRISFPGAGKKGRGQIHDFLPPPIMTSNEKLMDAVKRYNTSLKHICFAAYVYMLSMLTYESDVVMGLISNNRPELEDGDKIIGCFLNTLPFRINIPTGITWENYVHIVDKKLLQLKEYEKITFFEIVRIIGEGNLVGNPVFDTVFNFVDFHIFKQVVEVNDQIMQDRETLIQGYERTNTLFDLSIRPAPPGIKVTVRYSDSVVSDEIVKQLYGYFENILKMIVSRSEELIKKDEILSYEEKKKILYEFNDTDAEYPKEKTLHELFEEQVKRTPEFTAVIYNNTSEDEELSFEQCYFMKNPYIFEFEDNVLLLVGEMGMQSCVLLKTHKQNYVVVNRSTSQLLDEFTGGATLKSIFEKIKERPTNYYIYDIEKKVELCRIDIDVNTTFKSFYLLAKQLFYKHLLTLPVYEQRTSSKRTPAIYIKKQGASKTVNTQKASVHINVDITTKKSPVVLLGDAVGTATIGLLYLASYLKRNGIDAYCQWNDLNRKTSLLKQFIERIIRKIQPRIVGISMKWFPHIARALEICKIIKELDPSIEVVVGGNTASYYWENIIQYEYVNYVIRGDGEVPLLKICLGENPENIPNCVYKRNGKIFSTPVDYVQDEFNISDIFLSSLDTIFISKEDAYLAENFYINTGKGCTQNCFYCGGCNEAQKQTFNRRKFFLRGVVEVRNDILAAREYTSTFMFDFDLPAFNFYEYYKKIWEGIDLTRHFCQFFSWKLPSPQFINLLTDTFKYVYMNIDMCSFSESNRKKLESMGIVKPQPTDEEIFSFFDTCERYKNIKVKINQISGVPYFSSQEIKESNKILDNILRKYTCFGGMDWGRLHAQPGAPIINTCEEYNMISYAKTFEDFLHYSELNLKEMDYPNIADLNYPYIYSKDDRVNNEISKYYSETDKKLRENHEQYERDLFMIRYVSYRELDDEANKLASLLREAGVSFGDIVALMIDCPYYTVLGIFGILKSGGAYLPIDLDYPQERIDFMLKDSGVKILLTTVKTQLKAKTEFNTQLIKIIDIDNLLIFSTFSTTYRNCSDSPVYVIYTSGTSGRPKGILVEHRSIVNTLWFRKREYSMNTDSTCLQLFSSSFDGFVTSFFTPVISGAKVVLLNKEDIKDIARITKTVRKYRITHFICVPALYRAIIENLSPEDAELLKLVTLAGDSWNPELLALSMSKNPKIEIVSEYGVTEVSVMSTIYRNQEKDNHIKIGRPIGNTRIYILTGYHHLQPIGVAGELCISSFGVARGYLNNPGLTAEKFIDLSEQTNLLPAHINPKYKTRNSKLYCTGDLARWLDDGNIEFLGRIDHQVKIRGFRIELGEIESRLLTQPEIKEVVVLVHDGKGEDRYICAYIVSDREYETLELREYLSEELPQYMIPSYFVRLEKFPLTTNGKLNRKLLPEPEIKRGQTYAAPRNPIEEKLTTIWAEVIGRDEQYSSIGIDDNFFELGGHSIKAITLISRIHKELNVKLPVAEMFKIPTIRGLSEFIKKSTEDKYAAIEPTEEREFYQLSSAQKRMYIEQQMQAEGRSYNMPTVVILEGEIYNEKLRSIFLQLINRHESLKTAFQMVKGEVVQVIREVADFTIKYYESEGENSQEIVENFWSSFDLSKAPLLKVGLIKICEAKHIFMVDMHHIISDGVSHQILMEEFVKLYSGEILPPLRIQYKDFSEWQNRLFEFGLIKKQEEYWLDRFKDNIPILNLPTDYPRPADNITNKGDSIDFYVGEELTMKLYEVVKTSEITVYMFLLAVYNILLSKFTGQTDIIVVSPITGRRYNELENIIGMFVNMLVMRNQPETGKTFKEFLKEVKRNTLDAFENQEYQLPELVSKLNLQGHMNKNPLLNTVFTMQNINAKQIDFTPSISPNILRVTPYKYDNKISVFDLHLIASETNGMINLTIEYSVKLFRKPTIQAISKHYVEIIETVVRNLDIKIKDIKVTHGLVTAKLKKIDDNPDFGF